MIAPAKPLSSRAHNALNQTIEKQMLPRIHLMALRAFRDKDCELRYELVAEVVARAYAAFVRLAQQGRADIGYATPLALFSIKQVKSGRRMGTKLNIKDVSSDHSQIHRGITVKRLDRYDSAQAAWQEVVVEDKRSGPAEIAAMRIDFAAWLLTLTRRQRRVAQVLATGETTNATAHQFGVSASRISQLRRQLQEAWEAFVKDRPACSAA